MSLPAAQQRALEMMAEALRSSEPRLASMFAIFTRLTKNETWPRREQLPATPAWQIWLAAITRWLPSRQGEYGRRRWRRMLMLTPIAIALVLLVALSGRYLPGTGACGPESARAALVAAARPSCVLSGAGVPAK